MKRTLLTALLLIMNLSVESQKLTLSGYVKDMQGYYYLEKPIPISQTESFHSTTYNQFHNRLNLAYQPNVNLRFELGIRNRFLIGPLINDLAGYAGLFEADNGLVDLSFNLIKKDNWFLNSSIDRFYMDYTLGKLQLKLGRQRINWGINLVWNPNDLFNAFSYIDFDYEERPGSDAVLLTWYASESSSLDVAFKVDGNNHSTAALRYLFNLSDYDLQFIGGKSDNDWVLGGGWSGNIGSVSFRGEGTFFTPLSGKKAVSETSVSATLAADYTFNNDLFVHASILFNSMGTTGNSYGISLLNPKLNLNAKHLSIGKYELFGQISYPFSPILNASLAGIYNPLDGSSFLGPTANISLHDNLELMLTAQVLLGELGSEYGSLGNTYACFGRLRWSY